jgi:HSP20 family molecular chaperone IbpA/DNA-binding Xre family transcriptional regulator
MSTIHLRLRQLRRDRNLSQEELARALGISRQAIIALEQGTSLPSLPVLVALLRTLDTTFHDLCGPDWSPFRMFSPETTSIPTTELAQLRHGNTEQTIPVELTENDREFRLTAELAGVREEDVTIDMSPQHVVIMAIKKPAATADALTHYHEISFGPAMRILSLPSPINTSNAQAEFRRGMLYLTLPKAMPEVERRITFTKKEDHGSK